MKPVMNFYSVTVRSK